MSTSSRRSPGTRQALVNAHVEPLLEFAHKEASQVPENSSMCEAAQRHALIAEAAYLRAEQRHFEPGHEVEDWLAAESAIDVERPPLNTAPHP